MLKRAIDYLVLAAVWMTMPTATTSQEPFRPVGGAGLSERLARAVKQAGTDSPGKSFWTAYTFDVRNGVAVNIGNTPAFQGKVEALAGTELFYGTMNGAPATSQNVAFFSLHPAGSDAVTRVEIYNLDKEQRPADNYPVYWLGHATKEESLDDAGRLAESGLSSDVRSRATLAVALQDDPKVSEILKNLVSNSSDSQVRSIGIAGLGQLKTDNDFLAALANKNSSAETQIQTIQAIARDKTGDTFTRLRNLYRADMDRKVKMALIDAVANAREKDSVALFLLELEQNDPSPGLKGHAIFTLRRFDSNATIDELMRRFRTEQDENFKNQILFAFSQMENPLSLDKLFEAARQDDNARVRRQARFLIQDRIRKRVAKDERKVKDRKAEDQFEAEAERIIKKQSPSEAVTTLTEIAKTSPNPNIRMTAIFYLSKLDDPRVVDFYNELISH